MLVCLNEAKEFLIQWVASPDTSIEAEQLVLVGQLSVNEQECSLDEAGSPGELVDRDAAILQDTLLTVNVGDT